MSSTSSKNKNLPVDPNNSCTQDQTVNNNNCINTDSKMASSTPEREYIPFFGIGEIEYTPPCENCHHAYPNVASATSEFFRSSSVSQQPQHYPFCSSFEATQSMPAESPPHWPREDSFRRFVLYVH